MTTSAKANQSITRLIRAVQDGNSSAVRPLLSAYFGRLVGLASKRLRNLPGLSSYDEDLALRSFESVCQRLRDPARLFDLAGRDDLWLLLATRFGVTQFSRPPSSSSRASKKTGRRLESSHGWPSSQRTFFR